MDHFPKIYLLILEARGESSSKWKLELARGLENKCRSSKIDRGCSYKLPIKSWASKIVLGHCLCLLEFFQLPLAWKPVETLIMCRDTNNATSWSQQVPIKTRGLTISLFPYLSQVEYDVTV